MTLSSVTKAGQLRQQPPEPKNNSCHHSCTAMPAVTTGSHHCPKHCHCPRHPAALLWL